ncbi:hypothetical protein Cni_G20974 [Canna indica]|uniref:X8 domain-containing protein n=1 Tax=Canna indica TaxID=4628 RepID=A0AAQ3QJX1_9LILI|nr:hypothetical protein Cni_G20974 [Canna indica]
MGTPRTSGVGQGGVYTRWIKNMVKFQSSTLFCCSSTSALKTWCVAKPSTNEIALEDNIEFACATVKCKVIERGHPCFFPNTLISHASVVMNLYYQVHGRNYWNCNFTNSGLTTFTDPSYNNCKYMLRKSTSF